MRTESDTKAGSLSLGGSDQIPERIAAFQVFNQVKDLTLLACAAGNLKIDFPAQLLRVSGHLRCLGKAPAIRPYHFANRLVLREIEWDIKRSSIAPTGELWTSTCTCSSLATQALS